MIPGVGCAEEASHRDHPVEIVERVYRETAEGPLTVHIRRPPADAAAPDAGWPAVVFFFGGGWISGGPEHFARQAEALARRGMVTICADYRTRDRHETTPLESVADAVAAMRWTREMAGELGIDPARIAAGGGSAGGHLAMAAATAVGAAFDDAPPAARGTSFRPDALILINPVFDNSEAGYGFDRVREQWKRFSPAHNLHAGMPPTLTLLGDRDHLVPVETAKRVQRDMQALGVRSELIVYPGQPHGFANRPSGPGSLFDQTLADADAFLVSLGWLTPNGRDDRDDR